MSDAPDSNVAALVAGDQGVVAARGERAHGRVVAVQRRGRLCHEALGADPRLPPPHQLRSRTERVSTTASSSVGLERDANKTAGARVAARAEIFAFASHIAQAKPKGEVNAEVSCPQRK